jgi:anti-sigma B factor antagonist
MIYYRRAAKHRNGDPERFGRMTNRKKVPIWHRRWMERKVAIHNVDGLELNVDRGPNWLFVKLRSKDDVREDVPQIADKLWSISTRHFIYRLVLELEDLEEMPSGMMGQLVVLQERLAQCGGALRICGLSAECEEALQSCNLNSALPNHPSREAAVMGGSEVV